VFSQLLRTGLLFSSKRKPCRKHTHRLRSS
jgi:hypothetical protein